MSALLASVISGTRIDGGCAAELYLTTSRRNRKPLTLKRKVFLSWIVMLAFLLGACSTTNSSSSGESGGEVDSQSTTGSGDAAAGAEADDQGDSAGTTENDDPDDELTRPAENPGSDEPAASELSFAGNVPAPEFPDGLDWLNTERPLTFADLRGKVVVLDFWTYGCINCLHVIPELKALEEKYAEELVVIGVHSAKFENEGETENIQRIIQRYELEHPVVNDREFEVWSLYGARAWPTLIIIDPEGSVLGYHAGEAIYDRFDFIIGSMIAEFDEIGRIDRTPLDSILSQERQVDSPLLFPGKVLVDDVNDRLFIADSNHNRIVITDLEGNVQEVVGDGQTRLQDGDFEEASFFRPQGLALDGENNLYVADTENNAIRLIDLDERSVSTVAGTGKQQYLVETEVDAATSPLNSPWDVLYHNGSLYIAMAGQHQIWVLDPESGVLKVHAGSGLEELTDGSLRQGGLNQPSGLSTDGEVIFFADSEASAIRTADFDEDGQLQTIVGTGLFDFGDVDGKGDDVRLQHPLGVAYDDGLLYVADTYNSKIKVVDPLTRESNTFLGSDEAGWADGSDALFDEPGGITVAGDRLYIADTNNHVIRIADLESGEVSTLVLIDSDGLLTRQPPGSEYSGKIVELEPQSAVTGPGTIVLDLLLPAGYKVNDLAPFSMEWSSDGDVISFAAEDADRSIISPVFPIEIPVDFQAGDGSIDGELVIYYCDSDSQSLCLIERVRLSAPLVVSESGESDVVLSYTIPAPPL
jgi:thiol-disulfide isomerase/thioredoxin